jgi:hypothetical protein
MAKERPSAFGSSSASPQAETPMTPPPQRSAERRGEWPATMPDDVEEVMFSARVPKALRDQVQIVGKQNEKTQKIVLYEALTTWLKDHQRPM